MQILSKLNLKALFIFFLAILLLTPGYYGNTWRAAGPKWFIDWQKFHEHFVVARLVQSRQAGLFSYGGLLGYGDVTNWDISNDVINNEYALFANGGQFSAYLPYNSVPGLQALPFSLVDKYSGLAPATSLKVFRLVEAFLAAVVLALLLVWMLGQFGLTAALVTLAFLACSEWLTLYGGNFYWNLWAFYLPLTAFTFYIQRFTETGRFRQRTLFLLLAGVFLIKGSFNGFEFISTALVMPFTPLVYYAVRDRWPLKDFWRWFFTASLGALTGASVALGILALQVASALGSWQQSLGFIAHTLGRRSFGDPTQYNATDAESQRAGLIPVLETYFNGRALNLGSILHLNLSGLEFSYWQIFSLFLIASLLFLLRDRFRGGFPNRQTGLALLIATWFSALAPLSWFMLFKAHSYVHVQLNFIIWQMPFVIFGFTLCGFVLANLFRTNSTNEKTA
jgi:hypothetical protein